MNDHEIREEANFLMGMADTLERWVNSTVEGGWSTQLVQAQREQARICRERAALLYRKILIL